MVAKHASTFNLFGVDSYTLCLCGASTRFRIMAFSLNTLHSVGVLWTSDEPDAETSTWQHTTITTDKSPRPRAGFEPTFPARERP